MEQERRDHELALRLAQETNSFVEDISNTYTKYNEIISNIINW